MRAAWRWDFFGALRALECSALDNPRIGASAHIGQDVVRLCQRPDLTFRSSPFSRAEPAAERSPSRLYMNCFGLHGPEGPLPVWLTAYLADLERVDGDYASSRFFDLFNHRMACLVYRAWAGAMPAVCFDRHGGEGAPADRRNDPFSADDHARRIAALVGLLPGLRDRRWSLPPVTKLSYAGWFVAQTRCPEGLVSIIADYFGVPCAIEEFIPEEMELDSSRLEHGAGRAVHGGVRCDHNPAKLAHLMRDDDQARTLGWNIGNSLGRGALLGGRVRTCQGRFRLFLGPMTMEQYERMLPNDQAMRQLAEWIKAYVGDEFAWEARLILHKDEVPDPVLNPARPRRLGMTTWLQSRVPRHRSDLVIRPRGASFVFEHLSPNPHGAPRPPAGSQPGRD